MANRFPGTDLLLAGGDIQLETRENGGTHLALAIGRQEIFQAIAIRLGTRIQSDEFHPEVGLPFAQMVGAYNPNFIRGKVTQALLLEPRIQSVGASTITFDRAERVANLTVEVKLIDGTDITITEAFGL